MPASRQALTALVPLCVVASFAGLFVLPANQALFLASLLSLLALGALLVIGWPQAKVASAGVVICATLPVALLAAILLATARGQALPFTGAEGPLLPALLWLFGVLGAVMFAVPSRLSAGAKIASIVAAAASLFFLGVGASLWIGCTHGNCF